MAKMNMNYGMELMILILLVMIYPLLSLKCEEWNVDDFPPFVRELPQNGTEDFCNLYEQEMNISRYKFYDLMKAWAMKYHVLEQTKRFINQELDHERIRTEVLAGRLRDINGTIEAKKVLFRILKVQQNMSLSPMKIEQYVEDMMAALSERLQHEATNLWNKICPDDIYNPCPLVDDIYNPCPLVDDFYNPCPLVNDTI